MKINKSNLTWLIGIISVIAAVVIGFIYYGQGRGASHSDGIDFSNYNMWLLFLGGIVIFGLILFLALYNYAKPVSLGKGKGKGIKYMTFYYLGIALFLIGTIYALVCFVSVLRAWNDQSETADIEIATADSGDFTILSAHVESYHDKDDTAFKWSRILSYDDRYKLVFELNCTNFTDANGSSIQLYNDTVATLKGYNILKNGVTGTLSPDAQPGTFTITSESVTVVFKDVPRTADSPTQAITYFNLTLKTSSGTLLASWIVHTEPRLGAWVLNTQS